MTSAPLNTLSTKRNGLWPWVLTDVAETFRIGEPQVCRLCCLPFVAVMQAADFLNRDDRSSGRERNGARIWRVFIEAQMRAAPMIIPAVEGEDAS